jgi:hypothetical protein
VTIEHDTARIVRSWLEEGATALPDRVLDAVLDQLPATPQRRASRPAWRFADMSTSFKIALAAAALAVAVFGLSIPMLTLVNGPGTAPSPSTSPLPYTWPQPLAAGTYATRMIWDTPVEFTFTVPDGWQGMDVEVIKSPADVGVMFALVGNVYADPCGHVLMDPPVGPTVDDLAQALLGLPDTTPPGRDLTSAQMTPTTFAGYPAVTLSFVRPDDAGCPSASYYMWDAPPDSMRAGLPSGGTTFYSERALHRIWIVDINGIRYLVDASSSLDATEADMAELQSVIDSIQIRWTADAASFGDCQLGLTLPAQVTALEEPLTLTMGSNSYAVRGPYPVDDNGDPLTPKPPLAQIDFSGEGWTGAGLEGPAGRQGFQTHTGVGGFQGSFVFDAPGTWIASIDGPGCFRQFPIEVLPPSE